MRSSILTDRYAKAVFDIAVENNLVDSFHQDLSSLVQVFEDNSTLAEIFTHPILSQFDKNKIIEDFDQIVYENVYIKNLLYLLVEKKREGELGGIFESWKQLYNNYKKQLPVEVLVAVELNESQIDKLKSKLIQKTGKEPIITIEINPQLLGGMIVKYEDKIIDGSVLGQIRQLTESIKEIPVAKLRGEVV